MTQPDRNRKYDYRNVLSENIRSLMAAHSTLRSQNEIARHCKIPQRTVGRILNGETQANLSSIVGIAAAFGLAPWQLLVPDLDPNRLPRVSPLSAEQAAALQAIASVVSEIPELKLLTPAHSEVPPELAMGPQKGKRAGRWSA